jgi:hypothetical protein
MQCTTGEHATCGHRPLGVHGENSGAKGAWTITVGLCGCDCHATCPLAAPESVPESTWAERCTCPGVQPEVERRATRQRERAAEREVVRSILAQARPQPGDSKDAIRVRLLRVLDERAVTWPPSRIDATVDALDASTGHPLLVVPRFAARAAARAWRARRSGRPAD